MSVRETKTCVICAATIERPKGWSAKQWARRKCCSTVCQGRLHSIRMSRPKPHLRKPLTERLFARRRVDEETGCWEWLGTTNKGYGYIDVDERTRLVHRVAYEHLLGPIPEGLDLHHKCANRACFNPAHLQPLDRLAHAQLGRWAQATHCVNGHEWNEENTRIDVRPNGRRRRSCRACARERRARQREMAA